MTDNTLNEDTKMPGIGETALGTIALGLGAAVAGYAVASAAVGAVGAVGAGAGVAVALAAGAVGAAGYVVALGSFSVLVGYHEINKNILKLFRRSIMVSYGLSGISFVISGFILDDRGKDPTDDNIPMQEQPAGGTLIEDSAAVEQAIQTVIFPRSALEAVAGQAIDAFAEKAIDQRAADEAEAKAELEEFCAKNTAKVIELAGVKCPEDNTKPAAPTPAMP